MKPHSERTVCGLMPVAYSVDGDAEPVPPMAAAHEGFHPARVAKAKSAARQLSAAERTALRSVAKGD